MMSVGGALVMACHGAPPPPSPPPPETPPLPPSRLLQTDRPLNTAERGGARRDDILEVTYDARLDYPTYIRGDAKLGLPDDWFWVRARLEP